MVGAGHDGDWTAAVSSGSAVRYLRNGSVSFSGRMNFTNVVEVLGADREAPEVVTTDPDRVVDPGPGWGTAKILRSSILSKSAGLHEWTGSPRDTAMAVINGSLGSVSVISSIRRRRMSVLVSRIPSAMSERCVDCVIDVASERDGVDGVATVRQPRVVDGGQGWTCARGEGSG